MTSRSKAWRGIQASFVVVSSRHTVVIFFCVGIFITARFIRHRGLSIARKKETCV